MSLIIFNNEQDNENYSNRGQCYLAKPQAESDNIDRGLNTPGYPAKT